MALDRTKKKWRLPGIKLGATKKAPLKIQVMRTGKFWHPKYGKFSITKSDLTEIKANFDKRIRGIDPALDYAHESDKVAAAWFKGLELRDRGTTLWGDVKWTPKGEKIILDREYRYISADLAFKYKDNETLEEYGTVLLGAGLTNRPVIKNMEPTMDLGEEASSVALSEYEGQKMAKKILNEKTKKRRLAELELERKKLRAQLNLEETMGEDDEDEDDEDDGSGVDETTASPDEVKAAFGKLKKKVAGLSEKLKCMEDDAKKAASKVEASEKESTFNKMLVEGKAIEAQREHFLKGDMVKFAEAWKPVKLTTVGGHGGNVETSDAQDEIMKLAEEKVSKKEAKTIGEAIRKVMAEKPELRTKQQKETGFTPEFSGRA